MTQTMKAWFTVPGPEGAVFELRECPVQAPSPGQVAVAIRAAGTNRGELIRGAQLRSGSPAASPARAGGEFAGEIAALGEGVTGWKTGDHVMGRAAGSYAQSVVASQRALMRIPDGMSWAEAAAIPNVLLHPSSGYGRMWEWTANALGSRFHVYALDQRGHGDSGRPDGDYSAEEYANDLSLFFRAVGLNRAIIAGQSLGGRVGQVFAALYPQHTQAVALVGGPHPSNFFPTREATISVLGSAQRMLDSKTEFPSREAALEYVRANRPRDTEPARRHRVEHNMVAAGSGVAFKYDKVRVAIGLAHMADDLRKYAAKATCPVAVVKGSHSSELTPGQAKDIATCWKHGVVIDVEGDYALQMGNPAGLAQVLTAFADSA